MTVLAGILAEGGAVVASDSTMTTTNLHGAPIAGHDTSIKVSTHADGLLVLALTGETGAGGRICEGVAKHFTQNYAKNGASLGDHDFAKWLFQPVRNLAVADQGFITNIVNELAKSVKAQVQVDIKKTVETMSANRIGAGFALVGHNNRAVLARFERTDIVEVHRPGMEFAFLGSGQLQAEIFFHFLRTMAFPDRLPSLAEAELAAYWAVQHAIDVKAQGVGGEPSVAVLRHGDTKAEILSAERLEEHRAWVDGLRKTLADKIHGDALAKAPGQQNGGNPLVGG